MGNKLYKPKNKRKKENLKMIDKLEISGVTIAAIALLGWSGYSIANTFIPQPETPVYEVNVDSVSFTGEPKQQGAGNYSNNYGNGGYQQNNYQQNNGGYSQPANNSNQNNYNNAPSNDALSIGDLDDFEEVLTDDGVPF